LSIKPPDSRRFGRTRNANPALDFLFIMPTINIGERGVHWRVAQ
jgi:hypothetical protein